jgi:hypothetical protein
VTVTAKAWSTDSSTSSWTRIEHDRELRDTGRGRPSFTRPGNALDIALTLAVDAGGIFTVRIDYNGQPNAPGSARSAGEKWDRPPRHGGLDPLRARRSQKLVALQGPPRRQGDGLSSGGSCRSLGSRRGTGSSSETRLPSAGKLLYRWSLTDPDDDLPRQRRPRRTTRSSPRRYTPLAGGNMTITHYVYPEHLAAAQTSFSPFPR